jgi:hypothetical protein
MINCKHPLCRLADEIERGVFGENRVKSAFDSC